MIFEEMINTVIQGNVIDVLKQIPSESIDTVITSPPYWSLRNYGTSPQIWDAKEGCEHDQEIHSAFCKKCGAWKGELGLQPTFQLYIKHLCDIFDEIKRVLKNTGTCWVNLGDVYAGSGNGTNDYRTEASKSISGKRFDYNMIFQGKQKRSFKIFLINAFVKFPLVLR